MMEINTHSGGLLPGRLFADDPGGLTPMQIVRELDRYIVKQNEAKKAVAIALRNRWRRQMVPEDFREEIIPNNIIMIGPTGVGKTEIARRLAKLVNAPFVKVEATNYTEVGYVGRDVESMIRDLVEISVNMVKNEHKHRIAAEVEKKVEDRLIELLLPSSPPPQEDSDAEFEARRERTRSKIREKLRAGDLEERTVTIDTPQASSPIIEIFSKAGVEQMGLNLPWMPPLGQGTAKSRRMTVKEARRFLREEETNKALDMEKIVSEAKKRAESSGIVFIDEIDKISARAQSTSGPDVSREGVQRDLLPIVEGCSVNTRYGVVKTDHVLFIAAGAFNVAKPSDLIPEFQGRFPIRVELSSLGEEDFIRILKEPDNSLVKQYTALLAAENCKLEFTDDAIAEIARVARAANERAENIGARRLHTVMTTLLEDVLFELPESGLKKIVFDAPDVKKKLESILADEDLTRYIL
jgi:ATP-dependent HslUV protease ATP-binding subunit HslU